MSREYYERELRKRGNPSLSYWGWMALGYWQEEEKELVAELRKEGCLELAATFAQEQAKEYVAIEVGRGKSDREAEAEAFDLYIWRNPNAEEEGEELTDPQVKRDFEDDMTRAFMKWLEEDALLDQPSPPRPETDQP